MFTSRPEGPRRGPGGRLVAGCRPTRVRIDEDVSTAAQRPRLYPRVVADMDSKRGPCGELTVSLLSYGELPSGDLARILGLYAFPSRDDRAAMTLSLEAARDV